MGRLVVDDFGLIVIGDEVLSGARRDRHFDGIGGLLRSRGFGLAWFRILPDDPGRLRDELKLSMDAELPVFCCGGIGATPDDHTRAAAADAAGLPLRADPRVVGLIEARFGADAYPYRVRMADLPTGAELIPNPRGRIPGFALRRHYFLPGFPEMAAPMAAWVLDTWYAGAAEPLRARSVWILGVTETVLMPLMEDLCGRFPKHKLFSLPRLEPDRRVELGFRGRGDLDTAFEALLAGLDAGGFDYELRDD